MLMKLKIIFVAGPSGSGKSTFADLLKATFPADACDVVRLDDYYREHDDPLETHNYDVPEAYDFDQLVRDLQALRNGETTPRIHWDFREKKRLVSDVPLPENDSVRVIVVEGLMTLCVEEARRLADLKVFIDLEPEIGIIRRLSRDFEKKDRPGDPLEQFKRIERDVIPGNYKHVLPSRQFADLVVYNGEYKNLVGAARMIADAYSGGDA